MNKRLIIYIAIGLIVLVAGIFILFKFNSSSPTNTVTNTPSSTGQLPAVATSSTQVNITHAPQGLTFQIGTPKGLVTVNNFYTLPPVVDEEFLILQNTDQYQINYDTETNQFYIYFSSSPSSTLRTLVEGKFTSLLGISQDDACKLNVAEGFPGNLPVGSERQDLSFCNSNGAFQTK